MTPMEGVAAAVSDVSLSARSSERSLAKAYVNNGGDIALHLAPGETLAAGVIGDVDCPPAIDGVATISAAMPVRGIATSGWRGRSFSLGIADAATVLAADGAAADAAATLVGNAVDLDHPAIDRTRARDLDETSDLGERLVTTAVGPLEPADIALALARGATCAEAMCRRRMIHGAVLLLQRQIHIIGDDTRRRLHAEEKAQPAYLDA
jgi:ApbE superfamily uncharacterized protein (UPF0280 family)